VALDKLDAGCDERIAWLLHC